MVITPPLRVAARSRPKDGWCCRPQRPIEFKPLLIWVGPGEAVGISGVDKGVAMHPVSAIAANTETKHACAPH